MSKLIHEIDLEELGDAVAPIRDSIRKMFEDAYVDALFDTKKDVNAFHKRTKEQDE